MQLSTISIPNTRSRSTGIIVNMKGVQYTNARSLGSTSLSDCLLALKNNISVGFDVNQILCRNL